VEVLKPLDPLLQAPGFLGCEVKTPRVNSAIFGCERGHPFLFQTMNRLVSNFTAEEYSNQSGAFACPQLGTK